MTFDDNLKDSSSDDKFLIGCMRDIFLLICSHVSYKPQTSLKLLKNKGKGPKSLK